MNLISVCLAATKLSFFETCLFWFVMITLICGAIATFIAFPLMVLAYLIKWWRYIFSSDFDDEIVKALKGRRK